ncbi:MAG TPA: hydroxyacid dehydrogenase [Flexivirga sp.]|uniref:hydroxyacid dehydrogenase n=1 Tax=Flexivirga sp. TaxID=1962927 RepID=UPI002C20A57A|nr:hydroxyacid dehydrogenase [Flexivirga sp.]HWC24150.1 hydroxyacid dehydrogenase [Flexivirga sp.]
MHAESATRPVVCFAMSDEAFRTAFDGATLDRLDGFATVLRDDTGAPLLVRDFGDTDPDVLRGVDTLLTGWGSPYLDAATLGRFDQLRAVVHAAGSVKGIVDPCVWDAGVVVSTAAESNAVPVAEFTLATVVLAAKRFSRHVAAYRATGDKRGFDESRLQHGSNGITVGVVGASRIGRRVIDLLHVLDVSVLVSDPFLDAGEAQSRGAQLVELPDLLRRSDIVTLHAPAIPATRHLIDDRALALMRDGAVLINTARGSLVDTPALERHVVSGRLDAYLDVTEPEPLPADSPLFALPNVVLTPHIAGSMGNEVLRLGQVAVDEVERLAQGQPLRFPVRASELTHIA